MKVSLNVRGESEVKAALRGLGKHAKPALVASINRVGRDLRSRIVSKSLEVYNIARRELTPYVTVRRASGSRVSGSVSMLVRAIPIEAFRPRVRMQTFTFEFRGKQVTRRLPAIFLRRFKNGDEKYIGPAFPLTQRRSGVVKRGEKVRRRIGADRERLTRIRYYTFPKQFAEEVLLPDARAFIGPAIGVELRRAFRRYNPRRGLRTLRGNAA